MRLTLLALALALAGCDAFSDPAADFLTGLDGTWARTITSEEISAAGAVTPAGAAVVETYEIGRVITCNRSQIDAGGDGSRIAVAYRPETPDVRSCDVLSTDGGARRIILVGTAFDTAGTIVEDGADRQVWHFYRPQADGVVIRDAWTLERR